MKKVIQIVTVALFFAMLGIFMVLTVVLPKNDFSESENRVLAKAPELSAEAVLDKGYMKGIDTYVSDHFAFRNSLISVKTMADRFVGKKTENGVMFLDDRYVEPIPSIDNTIVNKSIAGINKLSEVTDVPVYVMIVPTSAGIYSSEIPSYYENIDQKNSIVDIYYNLNSNITTLNVFPKLYSSRDEYIYYRNDHHWTSYGAYVAYNAAIRKMGYNPTPFSSYDIEHVNNEFYGTYFSKALYDGYEPDIIDIFHLKSGYGVTDVEIKTGKEPIRSDSMYFSEYLSKKDKYSFFLNNAMYPVVNIKTTYPEENKILVIKDSYAQCFVPFLTQHFSDITMVDLRSVSPFEIESTLNVDNYDQILVLYNYSGFVNDTNLKKLSLLK